MSQPDYTITVRSQAELDQALEDAAETIYVQCGGGLHLSPSPGHALGYRSDATRFVKVGVRLDEMVTLDDKVKARRAVVPCVAVDAWARVIEVVA